MDNKDQGSKDRDDTIKRIIWILAIFAIAVLVGTFGNSVLHAVTGGF